MKNRQLSDQAAMLRAQLGDSLGAAEANPPAADPVLAELSARLAAVEDTVTMLAGQAAGGQDPAVTESVHQLEQRVARLRGVFDALRVDT